MDSLIQLLSYLGDVGDGSSLQHPWIDAIALTALLRACGLRTRFCSNLQSAPPNKCTIPNERQLLQSQYWCEIYLPNLERWLSVNPLDARVGDKGVIEPLIARYEGTPMLYVVGIDNYGFITDITRRYSQAFSTKVVRLRRAAMGRGVFNPPIIDWWAASLRRWANTRPTEVERNEEYELQSGEVRAILPATFGEYTNHPLYALERHLGKTQVIYPREPIVGYVKGEPVFLRSCVHKV
ncbi:hypothetical protein EV182_004071 [Spiromyces aspiralis]|uniref:Uncharacterized protein n=1 Tax=Spiromyces aspiralis TaxID=68401 RepID=A0ACC1HC57_9FUNG|nr:hypothetical protein EV182_004071 [Spiromyces aspiralis]